MINGIKLYQIWSQYHCLFFGQNGVFEWNLHSIQCSPWASTNYKLVRSVHQLFSSQSTREKRGEFDCVIRLNQEIWPKKISCLFLCINLSRSWDLIFTINFHTGCIPKMTSLVLHILPQMVIFSKNQLLWLPITD